MSFAALAWAAKCKAGSPSAKLVLLGYADRHNEDTGSAYPSIAWLCEFSDLNRKTVINAVSKLEAAGLLADTGERMGKTKQLKVYRVNVGTVPETVQSLKRNSSTFSVKQSQNRDTDTITEPLSPTVATQPPVKRARVADPYPKPEWAEEQHWQDFLANRREKKRRNTATAYQRLLNDIARLADDEWPPPRLLQHAAEEGWAGIYDPRPKDRSNGLQRREPRPDPIAAAWRSAVAEERAERDQADHPGARPALPSVLPGSA